MAATIKALRYAIARNPLRVKVVEIVLEALFISILYAAIHGIIVYAKREKIRATAQKRVHVLNRKYRWMNAMDSVKGNSRFMNVLQRAKNIAKAKKAAKKARKA